MKKILAMVELGIAVRDTLASRDWNTEPPWKVLKSSHRWSILKSLTNERREVVRALVTKRITHNPAHRPNALDPLDVIREMSCRFAIDGPLAAICLRRLYEEFKKGRPEEEIITRLHPGTKTLRAVAPYLGMANLWNTDIADAIDFLARKILATSPGFYELEPILLTLLPGSTFVRAIDALKLVADDQQAMDIWNQMFDAEAPGSIDGTRKLLSEHFPDVTFE